MSVRAKKLVGGAVMILLVIAYALAAMALAQARVIQEGGTLLQTVVFAILGLAWVVPLLPLIRWMERPKPGAQP
jgi:predicted tellurium resistance membrane protein TerC